MKYGWPWLLAALSGATLAFTLPPFEQSALVWIALTPLIVAIWFSPLTGRWRPLRLFSLGYLAGLVFFWICLFWLTEVTMPGWFLLAFYLALYPACWALFIGIVCRPRDPVPGASIEHCEWLRSFQNLRLAMRGAAAWAGLEWLRGVLFTGFGWNGLGIALWHHTHLIQIADFSGVAGVSFLIAMANLILVMTVRRVMYEAGKIKMRPHFDFTFTAALIMGSLGYGMFIIARYPKGEAAPPLNIAAVQANIPQDVKWDPSFEQHILKTYRRLTDTAIAMRPDLLIWPEAATPHPLLSNDEIKAEVAAILTKHRGDFLLGSINFFLGKAYNAAVLLDADGHPTLYHKMHLVPFGEYIPFRKTFPIFAWLIGDQVPGDFDAGTEPVVMTLKKKPYRIAPLICFEDTVGDLVRQFARNGAELLITITNDGWFRQSAGSRQHLANSIFRCAETKLPLVRAANTGVTCTVTRFGEVTHILENGDGDTFIEGVLFGKVTVPLQPYKTFYTRYGDLFAMLCFIAALLSIRTHLVTARRPGLSES